MNRKFCVDPKGIYVFKISNLLVIRGLQTKTSSYRFVSVIVARIRNPSNTKVAGAYGDTTYGEDWGWDSHSEEQQAVTGSRKQTA